MTPAAPLTNKVKTVPVLLLTLVVLAPASLSAPTPVRLSALDSRLSRRAPAGSLLARDSDPDDVPPSSTVTAFFTPAVFLQNYYSQSPVVLEHEPTPTPTPFNDVFMDPTATDIYPSAATVTSVDQTKEIQGSDAPSQQTVDNTSSTPNAATTSTDEEAAAISSSAVESVLTTADAASLTVIPLATPTLSTRPISWHTTSMFPTSTKSTAAPAASSTETHSSSSQRTLQSRKAAIIGTLLAIGSLLALMAFAFCMRLSSVVRRFIRKPAPSDTPEDIDDKEMDPEKTVNCLGYQGASAEVTSHLANTDFNNALGPPPSNISTTSVSNASTPHNTPQSGWNEHQQSLQPMLAHQGQFEDVTHILTDATFAACASDSGSERISSLSSEEERDRQSRGAASVAQSYATCESRYSTPSVQDVADVSLVDEQSASFHSAPSRSPSPPQSPPPDTPKAVHQQPPESGKRARSKTLNQGQAGSPSKSSIISSSKSFPARYSNRSSEHSGRWSVLEQESEWDIAAHYGARYSARHSAAPELGILADNMETVEIGGRNCVLVQGVAF